MSKTNLRFSTATTTTIMPRSIVDNRNKLGEIDPEQWKRKKYEEEMAKFQEYGIDALRYTYNGGHSGVGGSNMDIKRGNSAYRG